MEKNLITIVFFISIVVAGANGDSIKKRINNFNSAGTDCPCEILQKLADDEYRGLLSEKTYLAAGIIQRDKAKFLQSFHRRKINSRRFHSRKFKIRNKLKLLFVSYRNRRTSMCASW